MERKVSGEIVPLGIVQNLDHLELGDLEQSVMNSTSDLDLQFPFEFSFLVDSNRQSMPTQTFWYVSFSLMLCLAVFGNILILWIIIANRRMHSVTNYFLFNLTLADFTMASLNGIPNFIYMIQKQWIFGTILCMINNFVATLTVATSVFTMMAISIDRYLAIIYPLSPRMTKGSARKAIVGIWFCSVILALPSLIFSQLLPVAENGEAVCLLLWPDGKTPSESQLDLGYNLFLLCANYLIPMVAMGICYGGMSKELWRQSQIGESTQRQLETLVGKRKIVRMFIVIVVTFGICWFPYHAYFIYQYFDGSVVYQPWAQDLYLSFYWLAMSTSMINPIVYYFMNSRFRTCIQLAVFKCTCQGKAREFHHSQRRARMVERETPQSHSSGAELRRTLRMEAQFKHFELQRPRNQTHHHSHPLGNNDTTFG